MTFVGIVGSRQFTNMALMKATIKAIIAKHGLNVTIVSGGARGADSLAEQAAKDAGLPTIILPLDSAAAFETFGEDFRARAFGRNGWIVNSSNYLIAFFVTPEPSGGTLNTLNQAVRASKTVYAHFPTTGWKVY